MTNKTKPVFRLANGEEFFDSLDRWLAEPERELTEEELSRPVYDVRGKLLARTRREYEEAQGDSHPRPRGVANRGQTEVE